MFQDHRLPVTPPSGETGYSLNAFEAVQRSIVDHIISKSRSDSPMHAQQDINPSSEVTSMGRSHHHQSNRQEPSVSHGQDFAPHILKTHIPMESSMKKQDTENQSSERFSHWANSKLHPSQSQLYSCLDANVRDSRFTFKVDDDVFSTTRPKDKKFTSASAENINTKFSPEAWEGKFEGDNFFTPEQRTDFAKGRAGSKSRGRSPPKPRPGEAKFQAPKEMPDISVNPSSSEQTTAEDWARHFKPPTFAQPPPSSRSTRSAGKKSRPPRPNTAVVDDDDEDSSDGPPLFMGRNSNKSTPVTSNGNKSGVPPNAGSPDAMDIDSPPAVKTPVHDVAGVPVTPAASKGASHPPPSPTPAPTVPPLSEESKRAKRASVPRSSNGEGPNINLDSLKETEPIKPPTASGLNSFDDLFNSLPFESRASLMLPTTESFIPMAPQTPSTLTQATYADYVAEFKTYLTQWDLFNSRLVLHFVARKKQTVNFGNDFVNHTTDTMLDSYLRGLHEDQNLRTKWFEATQLHEAALKDFQGLQVRARSHGLGKAAN